MTLSIYLYFDGTCRDAFNFYRSVFGGEFKAEMTFAEGPPDYKYDPEEKDKIMHVTLPIGESALMGSDVPKGDPNSKPPVPSNAFAVSYLASSREDADSKFAALQADGGGITMPMDDMFWGAYFGMVKDRFGTHWMINHASSSE